MCGWILNMPLLFQIDSFDVFSTWRGSGKKYVIFSNHDVLSKFVDVGKFMLGFILSYRFKCYVNMTIAYV